jgi:hypothetical protein
VAVDETRYDGCAVSSNPALRVCVGVEAGDRGVLDQDLPGVERELSGPVEAYVRKTLDGRTQDLGRTLDAYLGAHRAIMPRRWEPGHVKPSRELDWA